MYQTNRAVLLGLATALVMLLAGEVHASPAQIKKYTTSSDELQYLASFSDLCGVNRENAINTIEGVMIRSRIVPKYGIDDTFLWVNLSCLDRDSLNPIFTLSVRYAIELEGEIWEMAQDYGSFGVGDEDTMNDEIKDAIERAVTDLILAHQD